ncbi:MAG: mobile mystery protein B [Bacteroidota bacterium]|nr:mobile mystery protein B [Bacteroidota bacterium]
MSIDAPPGATPVTGDDLEGLLLSHVATRKDLDFWEFRNILKAEEWAFTVRAEQLLREDFLRELHRRMYGDVWNWAGDFRRRQTNIGVPPAQIREQLRVLLDDATFWIANRTWPSDELLARFHHRLVWIHPFRNGNGRHARLMADVLAVRHLGVPALTWGSADLSNQGKDRERYIRALKDADAGDYAALLAFVRS